MRTYGKRPNAPTPNVSMVAAVKNPKFAIGAPLSAAKKRLRRSAPQAKARKVQRVLDFGQSKLGHRSTCSLCGLLYVTGDTEDEEVHRKECDERRNGVVFGGWQNERLAVSPKGKDGLKIVEIRPQDKEQHWQRVRRVLRSLSCDLNLCIRGLSDEGSKGNGHVAFLAVLKQRVVGICVTRALQASEVSYMTDMEGMEAPKSREEKTETEKETEEKEKEEATLQGRFLGIEVIWILSKARRKGLARALLEAARRRAFFDSICPRERVAFSQPTSAGLTLAQAYHCFDETRRLPLYGGILLDQV